MLFFCRSVLCTSGSTQNAEQCPTRMGRETNHTCHSQDCVRSARGNLTHQTCRRQTASNTSIPEKDGGKSVCPSPLVRQKGRRAALGFFKVPSSRMCCASWVCASKRKGGCYSKFGHLIDVYRNVLLLCCWHGFSGFRCCWSCSQQRPASSFACLPP